MLQPQAQTKKRIRSLHKISPYCLPIINYYRNVIMHDVNFVDAFEILTTIRDDDGDFVIFLRKRVHDVELTKQYVGNLWLIVKPKEERAIWKTVMSRKDS